MTEKITNELTSLDDLKQFITILYVENDHEEITDFKNNFSSEYIVKAVDNAEEAIESLDGINILISDYLLDGSSMNGLELIKKAKSIKEEDIETILITGSESEEIRQSVNKKELTTFLKKPLDPYFLRLYIKELSKRILFQQILNYDPDEIVIRTKTGTILYADKEKERIFGKKIIGEKCYTTFEIRGSEKKICDGCPGEIVLKEKKAIRREWEYITRGDINQHRIHQHKQYLDINVAPLKDKNENILGLIEISRDITLQKIMNQTIQEMESKDSFGERIEIFINVFRKLNIERVRLYLSKVDYKKLKLVLSYGHDKDFAIQEILLEEDKPSNLIKDSFKSILFKRDPDDDNRKYEPDSLNPDLFWVGKNNIDQFEILKKDSWVDIPLFAGGNLIGKVTIDGWLSEKDTPDHYDLGVFSEFGKLAGQVIENAKQKDIIRRKEETSNAILKLSKEITDISQRYSLLDKTLELVGQTLSVEMCSIFIFDERNEKLEMKRRWINKYLVDAIPNESYDSKSSFLTMAAYIDGKSQIIHDFKNKIIEAKESKSDNLINLNFVNIYEDILNGPLRNCIYAPLIVGDKKIGILRAMNKTKKDFFGEEEFDYYDLETFKLLAGQVAVAIHNSMLFKHIEKKEIQAKEARDRFQILFDMSPDGIVILDPNSYDSKWSIWDCNDSFCKMNGYSKDEILKDKAITDINDLNVDPLPREEYYKELKNKNSITKEVMHRHKDGTEFLIQTSSCIISFNGKEYILGLDRDISEIQRIYEIAKNIAHLTVRGEVEETIRNVLEATRKYIHCDNVILYVFDNIKDELNGTPITSGEIFYIELIKKEKKVDSKSVVYKMLFSDTYYIVPNTKEDSNFNNLRFTKEEKIESLIALPLLVKGKKVGVMFINYRSPHQFSNEELKSIELFSDQASVAIYNEQLSEHAAKITRMYRGRTALGLIGIVASALVHNAGNKVDQTKFAADLMEKSLHDDPSGKHLLNNISKYIGKINFSVQEYNDIVRGLRPEEITYNLQPLKVNDRIKDICEDINKNDNPLNINFIYDFNAVNDMIWTNPTLFNTLIENLIRNSVKALGKDTSIEKEINVKTSNVDNFIEIRIIDTGPGIPEEYTERLFVEPIEKSKSDSGFGIGCAIAGLFAETYKGSINLEKNRPGYVEILMRLPHNKPNEQCVD